MAQLTTKNDYMEQFETVLSYLGQERNELSSYMNTQFQQLNQFIEGVSKENFWQVFPKILGIDAKLTLLTELIPFEDFTNKEIIQMIEHDYRDYFKELCGYDLKMKDKPSIIFHLA